MFNKSIISITIISLISLSSVVNAEDTVEIETSSAKSEALAELRLSSQNLVSASAKMTQAHNPQGHSHIYTSGRNWVIVTDNDAQSGSGKQFITKNHR